MTSKGAWHSRVLYAEGPTRSAGDRTIEQCAMSAAGVGLYGLALLRRGLGPTRVVAQLSAWGRGIGPHETTCLDLETGEQLTVSSTDPDLQARRLRVSDLPPGVLAAWPRDDAGRPLDPGNHDRPSKPTVGPDQLRHIAATAQQHLE